MPRIYFVQQWFGLSMEEALFETALSREFVGLGSVNRISERLSILRFRHLLEEHQLAEQLLATVNATLTDSGLVHTVVGTAANVNYVTQASALVHGEETDVFADAGSQGVTKREEVQGFKANWHVVMRPSKRKRPVTPH
jgi:IS5 family transposase